MSNADPGLDRNDLAQAIPIPASRGTRAFVFLRRCALGVAAALGLLCLTLALATERTDLDPSYAGPTPLPAAVAQRFVYPEQGTPVNVVLEFNQEDFETYSTRWLKLEVTTPGFDPHVAQVIHYRPKASGPRSAVIVSPILGGSNEVAKIIAGGLAARGMHALIVLRAQSYLDSSVGAANLEVVLRTAVVDRRRAIDWLCEQDDVDPERLGAISVSVGGLATTIMVAVEPRIRAAVLVMAGGDLSSLLLASDQPRVRRFVRERAEHGVAADALGANLRAGVPSDPIALAPYVDARRCLAVLATRDTTVPYANQDLLYQALGRPERITLPTGHYTSALYLPYLTSACLGYLEEQLAR